MESYHTYQDNSALLGRTIKMMREKRQLTQEDLSEAADTGVPYISEIENGKANPSLKVITKLAIAFNLSIAELFSAQNNQLG